LDGGAGEGEAVVGGEEAGGFGGFAGGVFDGLGFVEDGVVEVDVLDIGGIVAEGPLLGADYIVVGEVVRGFGAGVMGVVDDL